MRSVFFVSGLMMVASVAYAQEQSCTYALDKNTVTVGWTGFKTTQKTGVNGTFKKVEVKGKLEAKTFADLMKGLKVSVDKMAIDSGNPVRDTSLTEAFFGKLKNSISGKIKSVSEDDRSLILALDFNGKTKDVPMHYEVKEDKLFSATGNIDVLDFGAKSALSSLNERCHDLHKGADGVSKTWSEAAINLKGTITKSCK
ncbi:MAG: YceI family protein [Oligoflexia bacterium]|nr:YceI family protein [Oligoflexia bacterium]